MLKLRDYQQDVINQVYRHFGMGKRRCLVFAPTGAGKSILIARIVKGALAKGKRVLIVVHRKKLATQLAATIQATCDHTPSLIAPRYKSDYSDPIQIAMAQTLTKRELPPNINILLGDESHQTAYFDIWSKCLDNYCGGIWALSKAFVIGFTATPWRTNQKQGFCHLFDCVAKAPSPRELIQQGYLTHPRLFAYSLINTNQLEVNESGDYTASSLSRVCNEEYNYDVVTKWSKLCPEKKTIVFCASVKQAKHLSNLFNEQGYSSEVVTGSLAEKKREDVFQRFKAGKTHVLVSVNTLTEGYDESSIECCLIARPTRSPALLIQMIGRALRLHKGKNEVFIVDCGDCFDWISSLKIGGQTVEDPIDLSHVSLCPKYRKPSRVETKACRECEAKIPVFTRICPECGYEPPPQTKIVPDLVEFPELQEVLVGASKKQYKWLRTEIKKHFERRTNPQTIFNSFHRRFNLLPPKDYFLGAVFGVGKIDKISLYQHFLTSQGITKSMVQEFINYEFGYCDRDYVLPGGTTYIRPESSEVAEFDPYDYLGVHKSANAVEIKNAYTDKLTDCEGLVLNYCYDFVLAKL